MVDCFVCRFFVGLLECYRCIFLWNSLWSKSCGSGYFCNLYLGFYLYLLCLYCSWFDVMLSNNEWFFLCFFEYCEYWRFVSLGENVVVVIGLDCFVYVGF